MPSVEVGKERLIAKEAEKNSERMHSFPALEKADNGRDIGDTGRTGPAAALLCFLESSSVMWDHEEA